MCSRQCYQINLGQGLNPAAARHEHRTLLIGRQAVTWQSLPNILSPNTAGAARRDNNELEF